MNTSTITATIDRLTVDGMSAGVIGINLVVACLIGAITALVALWVARFLLHVTIYGVRFASHHLTRTATGPHVCDIHPAKTPTAPLDHLLTTVIPVQRAVPTDTRAIRAVRPTITDTVRLDRVDVLA